MFAYPPVIEEKILTRQKLPELGKGFVMIQTSNVMFDGLIGYNCFSATGLTNGGPHR